MTSISWVKSVSVVLLWAAVFGLSACHPHGPGKDRGEGDRNPHSDKTKDPHIVRNPGDFKEDPKFVSAPTLGHPIYACGTAITVQDFIPGAKIEVFIDNAPAPNPSFIGQIPTPGQTHDTGAAFTAGKILYVTQTFNGATSGHSNSVMVTSHTEDFPAGLPKPRLFKNPLFQCGHAVLVEDVVPNSTVTIRAEDSNGAGGFKPAVDVGTFQASTNWGLNWSGVNPEFTLGARVSATAQICTDTSPRSDDEITVPPPAPVPPGATGKPIIAGQTLISIWGAAGPPNDPPQHGAIVTVRDAASAMRGQSAIPGGVPHTLGIAPAASAGQSLSVTQTLCTESVPGTPTVVGDCKAMPAPVIKPPLPGDTKIIVTQQIPGAEILIFANGQEVGHSSGSIINLSRPLLDGETVIVEQRLGKCTGRFVYQIKVGCALGTAPGACSSDWPAFRQNGLRTARQVQASPLGDPYAVKTLVIKARVTAPDGGNFNASPVIFGGRVFIGSNHGHLYAFDAHFSDGASPLWQYPPPAEPALASGFASGGACHNPSSEGVAASVAIAVSKERGTLVILAAPDRGRPDDAGGKFGSGFGSGRVFALNPANGALVWKTREEIARMTGLTGNSKSELHEQIGYSSPLVLGNRIYVGIGDHCDNPIQNGQVKAIAIDTGAVDAGFSYQSTNDRGGGVWTFVSGGLGNALVTTTGNVKNGTTSEPTVNNGLSMVRMDPVSGALGGKIQPVPYVNDSDPDWSAGATLMAASCGNVSVSTMKDGFSYAGDLGPPLSFRWQYPNVAYPFPTKDPLSHGDIRYHRAGAGWNDIYFSMSGGPQILDTSDPVANFQGYRHLHAFDVCAGNGGRVRWVAILDNFTTSVTNTHDWGLGPPTVTDGIVYVGTNRGFLLAIADTSVWPSQGARCTLPTLTSTDCVAAGYQLVPNPTVLKSLDLGGQIVRGEPALANGMVYVANSLGRLFRIAPESTP
jgi:outer membrane protein assembly factor BamB